jgi:hypothetical protein
MNCLVQPAQFFAAAKLSLFGGKLSTAQVDGLNALLAAFGEAGWPIADAAYGLATAYHETNKSMQPVAEAYFLGESKATGYRKTLRYFPWYGRGYPQVTWRENYAKVDKALGLNGALLADPDLLLHPHYAAKATVVGMSTGMFTGRALKDYLPRVGRATTKQFTDARRIINIQDKAAEIAGYAILFQKALEAGTWG